MSARLHACFSVCMCSVVRKRAAMRTYRVRNVPSVKSIYTIDAHVHALACTFTACPKIRVPAKHTIDHSNTLLHSILRILFNAIFVKLNAEAVFFSSVYCTTRHTTRLPYACFEAVVHHAQLYLRACTCITQRCGAVRTLHALSYALGIALFPSLHCSPERCHHQV